MPRRTKEELRVARNIKRIDELVVALKWLREPKFYKTNRWSMAAFDSWAARGQAGSCGCGCGKYNASLTNTRHSTKRGGGESFCKEVLERVCWDCLILIEEKLNVQFKRF